MNIKRKILSSVAGAALVAGAAVPALAVVVPAGGGTWSYGTTTNGTIVYSNYYHRDVTHRGSTINAWGEYSCTDATKGKWANNSQRAKPGVADNSYWAKARCSG